MFHQLASYYDLLASHKDYRAEAEALEHLARRFLRSKGRTWLDVACGTGRHLEEIRRKCSVTGVDLSREMLRVARRRLPGVRLYQGDMRAVRLGRRFDVISCLYGAIGRLPSRAALRATFANLERHLEPGGVVIVEPWISPAVFRAGSIHLVTGQTNELAITRMAYSRRTGHSSMVEYHYLIGRRSKGIEYVRETNRGLLVTPDELVSLLEGAGLRARFLRRGLTPGRGLLVGVKPLKEPRR